MCKWDSDRADYVTPDGQLCRRDDYGDKTTHCTAKRSCSHHVGQAELTCGRCLGDVRNDVRSLVGLAALMPVEALTGGVNSEAAVMAGPAADYRVFAARRTLDRRWLMAHIPQAKLERAMRNLLDDDDERHPYSVLTRWHLMLAEDYEHPLPERMTVADSAAYLERHLHTVAQDDGQDFPLLRREIRKCRQHLETVLHNSRNAEKGAPCPRCGEEEKYVRLTQEFAHWCLDPECCKEHFATDEADRWVCPRIKDHWWSERDYRSWVEERRADGGVTPGPTPVRLP